MFNLLILLGSMQQVQYVRGTAQCYGQRWVKNPEAQEKKKRKKHKGTQGMLLFCLSPANCRGGAQLPGAVAIVAISPGTKATRKQP